MPASQSYRADTRGHHGNRCRTGDHETGARSIAWLNNSGHRYRIGRKPVVLWTIRRGLLSVAPIVGLLMGVLRLVARVLLAHSLIRTGFVARPMRVPRVIRHVVASYFLRTDSNALTPPCLRRLRRD